MTYKINSVFKEFLLALDFILKWKGVLSNDSKDYGGVTYTGITQDSYDTYCKRVSKNRKLVKDLTEINIVDFYWLDRYISFGADKLPSPLSLVIFDTSVLFSVEASFSFVN